VNLQLSLPTPRQVLSKHFYQPWTNGIFDTTT
jgi:hypothetical protein